MDSHLGVIVSLALLWAVPCELNPGLVNLWAPIDNGSGYSNYRIRRRPPIEKSQTTAPHVGELRCASQTPTGSSWTQQLDATAGRKLSLSLRLASKAYASKAVSSSNMLCTARLNVCLRP